VSVESGSEQPVQGQEVTPGTDPAPQQQESAAPWAEDLNSLPESVRPLVEPLFKKYDAQTTQRFQQVHSQYEPLKAWEPLASEWDLESAQQALQLMEAINENPEQVWRALAEAYNFGDGEQGHADPGGSNSNEEDPASPFVDPRFQTIEEMTNAMAEILLKQEKDRLAAEEDAELEQYLSGLKEKHGDYDEDYVLAHMQLGMSGEDAIAKYKQMLSAVSAPRTPAPAVLGSGGSLPSQSIDPAKLSSKDTKDLVAQMLAQAANQSEG
jgi:hypothetical protein